MGEYVWTQASVGGKLKRSIVEDGETRDLVAELNELIEPWCNGEGDTVADAVKEKRAAFVQGERNFGSPDDLVDFCREHDLTIEWSWAAAGGAFGSGASYWEPGLDKPWEYSTDDEASATVTLVELRDALTAGKTLAEVIDEYEITTREIPPLELVEEKETV